MSKGRLIITAVVLEGRSKGEAARDYDVSCQWVHHLVTQYRAEGEAAEARSRRPHTSPGAVSADLEDRIVRLRKESRQGLDVGAVPSTGPTSDLRRAAARRRMPWTRMRAVYRLQSAATPPTRSTRPANGPWTSTSCPCRRSPRFSNALPSTTRRCGRHSRLIRHQPEGSVRPRPGRVPTPSSNRPSNGRRSVQITLIPAGDTSEGEHR